MYMLKLAQDEPTLYVMLLAAIIGSVVLHELGHAWTATWQGDPTPRLRGHLTWDPRVHMGWISLILAATFGFAFGLTPVEPRNFRNRRWGDTMVSFAGPAVNLLIWFLMAVILGIGEGLAERGADLNQHMGARFVYILANINLALFIINMIPLPPFDGFTVIQGFFDLGAIGDWLKRAGMLPMLIAIVLLMQLNIFGFVSLMTQLISGLVSVFVALLTGAAG